MSVRLCVGLFVFVFLHNAAFSMRAFTSDGCSFYPDGQVSLPESQLNKKWYHCCFTHDISYWMGGERKLKKAADQELNRCVSKVTNIYNGRLMELGVIIGGVPYLPLSWRWGYGHRFTPRRGYSPLSKAEKNQAFKLFDEVLDKIENVSYYLVKNQVNYMVDRYEFLRQKLKLDSDFANEEDQTMDDRQIQIQRIRDNAQ